jgi:hypothetical protein
MKLKATLLGIGFLFFSLYLCNLPAVAEETEQNTETTIQPFRGLPIRKQNQIIEKKIKQSQQLSHWVYETLEKEKASVAIITRKGPPLTRFLDKTGLTHVGFVFKRPDTKQWITYSLIPARTTKQLTFGKRPLKIFITGKAANKLTP